MKKILPLVVAAFVCFVVGRKALVVAMEWFLSARSSSAVTATNAWKGKLVLDGGFTFDVPFGLPPVSAPTVREADRKVAAFKSFGGEEGSIGLAAHVVEFSPAISPKLDRRVDASLNEMKNQMSSFDMTSKRSEGSLLGQKAVMVEGNFIPRGAGSAPERGMDFQMCYFARGKRVYILMVYCPAGKSDIAGILDRVLKSAVEDVTDSPSGPITSVVPALVAAPDGDPIAHDPGASPAETPSSAPVVPPIQRGVPALPAGMERRNLNEAIRVPEKR